MAKKIDTALRDLVKALDKHAALASDPKSGKSKIQRAAAKVRTSAKVYQSVIVSRTGTDSPFTDIADPRLDAPTVKSLTAERDALAAKVATEKARRKAAEESAAAADSAS